MLILFVLQAFVSSMSLASVCCVRACVCVWGRGVGEELGLNFDI